MNAIASGVLALAALGAHAQSSAPAGLPDPVRFGIVMELNDLAQVGEWLDRGLDPNFVADRIGTGLMIAAWEGNIPMMELFVSRGADINRANARGEQALMHAAWRGRLDAVKWLLERGARINREGKQWSALHYAAFAGHQEVARYLIERGADVNAKSTNGSSVLMMAVYEGREAMVRQLLSAGADRSLKNDNGEGALDWAFRYKQLSIARIVGSSQEFAAAANRPKSGWGDAVRSRPAAPEPAPAVQQAAQTGELEDLLNIRALLISRGLNNSAAKLDNRIAALRAKRAHPERDVTPATVLEITASRAAPRKQNARLITAPVSAPAAKRADASVRAAAGQSVTR